MRGWHLDLPVVKRLTGEYNQQLYDNKCVNVNEYTKPCNSQIGNDDMSRIRKYGEF